MLLVLPVGEADALLTLVGISIPQAVGFKAIGMHGDEGEQTLCAAGF